MNKEKIIRLVELVTKRTLLEENDKEKKRILESGSYAINEGYRTPNMEEIDSINKEIESL